MTAGPGAPLALPTRRHPGTKKSGVFVGGKGVKMISPAEDGTSLRILRTLSQTLGGYSCAPTFAGGSLPEKQPAKPVDQKANALP